MRRKLRSSSPLFIGLLLVALIGVSVPVVMAGGATEPPPAFADAGVLELELGRADQFTWDGNVETISSRRNDCTAVTVGGGNNDADLVEITALGGALGFVKDGFGVQGPSDGSGEPCGRMDAPGEAISIKLSGLLGDPYYMTAIDLDLEFKFDGAAEVEFFLAGARVAGPVSVDPASPSDDGPDSRDGDNYRVFIDPSSPDHDVYFDEVRITATAGAVSLEGGADGTEDGSLAPSGSSQFQIVRQYDRYNASEILDRKTQQVFGMVLDVIEGKPLPNLKPADEAPADDEPAEDEPVEPMDLDAEADDAAAEPEEDAAATEIDEVETGLK